MSPVPEPLAAEGVEWKNIDGLALLDAALAENARLEALIVEADDTQFSANLVLEADRIRCRRSGVECPTRGKKE